jgi:hypothetical protein
VGAARGHPLLVGGIALLLTLALAAGCGQSLSLQHSETPCIVPGQVVTLRTTAPPGTTLRYGVQDDFGGDLSPTIPPVTVGPKGNATVTWQSPSRLSTTTLHFLLTARDGDRVASRDIHVVVGGNGRSC